MKYWVSKLNIKNEIRVIGFDDGPFVHIKGNKTLVVGVILRAREYLDGVLSTYITIDGLDATDKIIELVNKSRHCDQLRVILFDGLAVAGFNLIDIHRVCDETGKIVIAVTSKKPNPARFVSALKNLDCYEVRFSIVDRAGDVRSVEINGKPIYFQCAGIGVDEAKVILKKTSVRSAVPEAIRMAHIIASGIVDAESRGRP
ncbi:MAG: hypothetical protein DRN14_07865 [Thermoplasmata archaeon]|nr:MAG: hypothetical protein DRN14_07865 [Thermoplasmata archaeon]